MNNEQEQKELEYEIIELESQLAYKKEKYNRLKFINANSRYFLCETGDIYELLIVSIWKKPLNKITRLKQ